MKKFKAKRTLRSKTSENLNSRKDDNTVVGGFDAENALNSILLEKNIDKNRIVEILNINPDIYLKLPLEFQMDDDIIFGVFRDNIFSKILEYLPPQKKTPTNVLQMIKRGVETTILERCGMRKDNILSDDFLEVVIQDDFKFESIFLLEKIPWKQLLRLINKDIKYLKIFFHGKIDEESFEELQEIFESKTMLPFSLENLVSVFPDDMGTIYTGVLKSPNLMKYASDSLKSDINFCRSVLKVQPMALEHMSKSIQNDKDLVSIAVQHNVESLQFASNELRSNEELMMNYLNFYNFNLKYVSEELLDSKEFLSKVLNRKPTLYSKFSETWRSDPDITLQAVANDGMNLQFASEELKNSKPLVIAAIQKSHGAIQFASDELKDDTEVVLEALSGWMSNDNLFMYASDRIKNEKKLIVNLLNNKHSGVLHHASMEIRTDKQFMTEVISKKPELARCAPQELLQDKYFILNLVLENPSFISHVDQSLLSIKECIATNPKSYIYFFERDADIENNLLAISAPRNESVANFVHFPYSLKNDDEFLLKCVIANPLLFEMIPQESTVRNNKSAICFSKGYFGYGYSDKDRRKYLDRQDWYIFGGFYNMNFKFIGESKQPINFKFIEKSEQPMNLFNFNIPESVDFNLNFTTPPKNTKHTVKKKGRSPPSQNNSNSKSKSPSTDMEGFPFAFEIPTGPEFEFGEIVTNFGNLNIEEQNKWQFGDLK